MRTVTVTQGERADFPSLCTRYVLRGEDTAGRFALIEHEIPPRGLAAPTHVHQHEDEYSFVLTGRLGVQVGDEVSEAGPGDFVAKPRDIPHAFWNAGDEPARLLELISPAGFERFFAEASPVLMAEGEPDFERLTAIQASFGLTMDFDSIGPLVERHGLRF